MNKQQFIEMVSPHTMTSIERISTLYDSLEHIRLNNIPGDIVECGVWKGGNIYGTLEYLFEYKIEKNIWIYDTFEGMTSTTVEDFDFNGNSGKIWEKKCFCSLEDVKSLMNKSNYKKSLIKYVKGDICETLDISENIPDSISLLRLDTDWYLSTKKELEILFPKLVKDGILIVDDYGHWQGSKKAFDEYFGHVLFEKIDYTGIKLKK